MTVTHEYIISSVKDTRLKVMELETQNQVIANQLKRQAEETNQLREFLENKNANESKLERQVREAQRKYADLESRMKEDLMMARIRGDFKNKILKLKHRIVSTF